MNTESNRVRGWRKGNRRKIRTGVGVLLPGLIALLVMPALAHAKIIEGRSVADVKLGDTKKQVKKVLGEPESTHFGDFFYDDPRLRIHFKRGKVSTILSFSKRQKTAKGVTIGSTKKKVRASYPTANCAEGPEGPGSLLCVLNSRFRGKPTATYLRFGAGDNRVGEISVYNR